MIEEKDLEKEPPKEEQETPLTTQEVVLGLAYAAIPMGIFIFVLIWLWTISN